MTRTQLINVLIASNGFTSYLEIGCQGKVNFNKINCPLKLCVDPDPKADANKRMSSDDFFVQHPQTAKFDIIFIDGLHHSDQVERDTTNSMRILKPGGIIVLHDCNPPIEKDQLVPRQHKVWYGDVWRAFVGFRMRYPDVRSYCIDDDCGCGVIHYTNQEIKPGFITPISWQDFDIDRKRLLNLI